MFAVFQPALEFDSPDPRQHHGERAYEPDRPLAEHGHAHEAADEGAAGEREAAWGRHALGWQEGLSDEHRRPRGECGEDRIGCGGVRFDRHQQTAHVRQRREHAGQRTEPACARPQEGERREHRGHGGGQPRGHLRGAEEGETGGHAPVHEHRLVDRERAVVGRHDPVAGLEHRAGDGREAGLVFVPEGGRPEADGHAHDRGAEHDGKRLTGLHGKRFRGGGVGHEMHDQRVSANDASGRGGGPSTT